MSFSINTFHIARVKNYADANTYFNNRKKVRSHRWTEDQRPLRCTRDRHIRIERGNGGEYFDLVLYQTALIRYFKPADNGEYAVWLANYPSTSTSQFMWAQGWHHGMTLQHDGGDTFVLPISYQIHKAKEIWGAEFSVKLVFNDKHQVVRDKSIYLPACGSKSSTTMRAKRKAFRDRLAVIMDMVDMRFGEHESKCIVQSSYGAPFNTSMSRDMLREERKLKDVVKAFAADPDGADPTDIAHYAFEYAQVAYNNIVNKRAYSLSPPNDWERDPQGGWRRRSYDETQYAADDALLIHQFPSVRAQLLPDQAAVRKAVENRLVMLAGLDFGDAVRPYPLFAKELPRKTYAIKADTDPADLFAGSIPDNMFTGRGVAG